MVLLDIGLALPVAFNYLATFTNLEKNGTLSEPFASHYEMLADFLYTMARHNDLEFIGLFLVHVTIQVHPRPSVWAFERVTMKLPAYLPQDPLKFLRGHF
jgi:hypothetical protein